MSLNLFCLNPRSCTAVLIGPVLLGVTQLSSTANIFTALTNKCYKRAL